MLSGILDKNRGRTDLKDQYMKSGSSNYINCLPDWESGEREEARRDKKVGKGNDWTEDKKLKDSGR